MDSIILQNMPHQSGIYQMFGKDGQILYVGKARDLQKRLKSYFQKNLSAKTHALMQKVTDIKIILTQNETEALLLEANLIKEHHPRYNILLRDDKSYPYLYFSTHERFPRIAFYRGGKNMPGRFFGPYPSVTSVRETLDLLQKVFKVRQCENTFFQHRSRPCLQYQLGRCTAPCVNYISEEGYREQVNNTISFLEGHTDKIILDLKNKMAVCSDQLDYEKAAEYRDQLDAIENFQTQQTASKETDHTDIIGMTMQENIASFSILFIRHGHLMGHRNFVFPLPLQETQAEILKTFLIQYYLHHTKDFLLPSQILLPLKIEQVSELEKLLSAELKKKIKFITRHLLKYSAWEKTAKENAEQALNQREFAQETFRKKFETLKKICALKKLNRIECFDISHTQGEATVASCIVFDRTGPLKKEYRQFLIKNIKAGDDYAAMSQAIERRYARLLKEKKYLPDLVIVDGGKGQLSEAKKVFENLKIKNILLLGIAKGPARKAGLEQLFLSDGSLLDISPTDSAFYLIQNVRDEAHRFAITAHRKKRGKKVSSSFLENIPGIGIQKRKNLLKHFGGVQALKNASKIELEKVSGITPALAETILNLLKIV